jgi:hypothetical protein
MRTASVILLLLVSFAVAAPVPPARTDPAAKLEQKLIGEWTNGGACVGDITISANGRFERRHYGPGNATLAGSWKLNWDALPPTLQLVCDTSEGNIFEGTTQEYKLTRLDDKAMHWESDGEPAGAFGRAKQKE